MQDIAIGVIGGSGLYRMEGLEDAREHTLDTPFGQPSDVLVSGRIDDAPVVFLARHGRGHRLLPGEVNYRANVYALKSLGVKYLISVSAVGSLREAVRPLDMLLPDQFIDLTKHRESSFFGCGAVAHVAMGDPVCAAVSRSLEAGYAAAARSHALDEAGLHRGGTYVCIEGPQFSTRAESAWYRSLGAAVIGMTNMPEAKLAREAEIGYATLALVTDYDCWHPRDAGVTADLALANLMKNAAHAQTVVRHAIAWLHRHAPESAAHTALDSALVTQPAQMSEEVRTRLAALIARRIG
ncbi:MAG: S-methyl-5'-thioadenosine phosphorylase [Methylibium sp.]|uniref:S-methyl-5'-thioadenosine phosphorylase n=1 Tax=Methylibium sp. TaxID=2067992 RepID=UPI0017DEAB49|nr:S-methyl-5'-thioadenosine phosphorylase [Methylibium sp.]MBA3597281.1 S-methyl-5'-thioadenosine phosphorylase [Methylibium sp.]